MRMFHNVGHLLFAIRKFVWIHFFNLIYHKMNTRSIFIYVLFLGMLGKLDAQAPVYVNYTVNDGLAGDVVYDVVQDKDGYIWIATESGISRFDGVEFKNFSQNDGLPSGEVIKMYADDLGRVWFVTVGGDIAYAYERNFYNRKSHPELAKIDAQHHYSVLETDSKGNVWLAETGSGVYKISTGNAPGSVEIRKLEDIDAVSYYGIWEAGEDVCIWGFDTLYRINEIGDVNKTLFHQGVGGMREVLQTENNELVIRNQTNIIELKTHPESLDTICDFGEVSSSGLSFPINSMSLGSGNELWVAKENGVLRLQDPLGEKQKQISYFEGHPISTVFQDQEGNIWFGSLRRGLFFASVQALQARYFGSNDVNANDEVISVSQIGDDLIFGRGDGAIEIWNGGEMEYRQLLDESQNRQWVRKILQIDSSQILIGGDHRLLKTVDLKTFETNTVNIPSHKGSIKDLEIDGAGFLYIAWNGGCDLFDSKKTGNEFNSIYRKRCSALAKDQNGKIWLGTEEGIGYVSKGKFILYQQAPELIGQSIQDLIFDSQNRLWVAAHGNGLFILEGDTTYHLTRDKGLLSDNCKSLTAGHSEIWVATNQGINRIQLSNGEADFLSFTRIDGLPTNDVNAIEIFRDTIWAGTRNGIIGFPTQSGLGSLPAPKIYLTSVLVNDSSVDKTEYASLSNRQNSIQVEVKALSYHSLGQIEYEYLLEGLHDTWHSSGNGKLGFEALPPGDYELKVKARGYKTVWSPPTTFLSFTIRPPFWLTWWFISLVFLCLLFLILLLIRGIKQKADRKNEIALLLASSEQKALRAQMNPHFIFNCLNSIQMFIMDNDQDQAYEYLQKFGALIRMILEHSRKETITLEKEIETLRLYVELEALRLDQVLDYQIHIAPGIDVVGVRIPSMLIQPYIENAIIHGLNPKLRDLKLSLTIKEVNAMLVCDIVDNGIGQKAAAEIRKKRNHSHASIGQSATQERLQILNAKRGNHESLSVRIENLEKPDGNSAGTHVQIIIPMG